VLGGGAEPAVVAALTGSGETAVADAVVALARVEILRPDPPLDFVHPLVRDAVYHALPAGERALEHERAADALRAAGAADERVAAQLLPARRRAESWASALLERAAAAAMAQGAADSAAAYLRRALAEPPPPERRTQVLLALAEAEALTHGPTGAERMREAFAAVTEPAARARVGGLLARLVTFTGRPLESAAIARAARDGLPRELADLGLWLEANELVNAYWGDDTPGLRARLAQHRRAPDGDGLGANSLAAMASLDWSLAGGGADDCSALLLGALSAGDLIARDNGPIPIGSLTTLTLADRDEALELLDAAFAHGHESGSVLTMGGTHFWRGFLRLRRGDLAEAEALLRAAITLTDAWGFNTLGRRYPYVFLGATLLARGELAGARRELERFPDGGDSSESTRWLLVTLLELLAAERRWDDVPALAAVVAARWPWATNPAGCGWRAPLATALAALGRRDEALAAARENLVLARAWGAPGTVGAALRALGTLAGAAGIAQLEEAVAVLEPSPARLEHARALAALGAARLQAGDAVAARAPLRRALDLAGACAAPGLADQVRRDLEAAGARPRAGALAGPAALTTTERRVADLAAGGDTNRDIAQALFVTPKTVEVHLSSVYRKLGIRSRRELPEALAP
jgi:DNA-binding CsgD family transcriptional regulator